MDVDLPARMTNDLEAMAEVMREICKTNESFDGIVFHSDSVQCRRITEDAHYQGIRATFLGTLENARIHTQIDVGFGDVVYPGPINALIPGMLEEESSVQLPGYTKESSIAEKTVAMISRGIPNSRMKDFYDIWLLSDNYEFDGKQMHEALKTDACISRNADP